MNLKKKTWNFISKPGTCLARIGASRDFGIFHPNCGCDPEMRHSNQTNCLGFTENNLDLTSVAATGLKYPNQTWSIYGLKPHTLFWVKLVVVPRMATSPSCLSFSSFSQSFFYPPKIESRKCRNKINITGWWFQP